jgi:hypothetical protein
MTSGSTLINDKTQQSQIKISPRKLAEGYQIHQTSFDSFNNEQFIKDGAMITPSAQSPLDASQKIFTRQTSNESLAP